MSEPVHLQVSVHEPPKKKNDSDLVFSLVCDVAVTLIDAPVIGGEPVPSDHVILHSIYTIQGKYGYIK